MTDTVAIKKIVCLTDDPLAAATHAPHDLEILYGQNKSRRVTQPLLAPLALVTSWWRTLPPGRAGC